LDHKQRGTRGPIIGLDGLAWHDMYWHPEKGRHSNAFGKRTRAIGLHHMIKLSTRWTVATTL
jgi:hypothetical protein